MPWQVVECDDYLKRKREFNKKWPEEMVAIATNLATLFHSLNLGAKPEQLKSLGFVRSEPLGILAISERGVSKGTTPKALRLYVYPDEKTETAHLMLIGEKQPQTQSRDIKLCRKYVESVIASNAAAEAQSKPNKLNLKKTE